MTFDACLDQALAMLRKRGRVSYRALQRQLQVDAATLDDLKAELLYVHPEVVEDADRGLIWCADPALPGPSSRHQTACESRFYAVLPAVKAVLQHERRVTYRRLQYIFNLDQTMLDEVRHELLFQQVARDEQGEGLVWTGAPQLPGSALPAVPVSPEVSEDGTAAALARFEASPSAPETAPPVPLLDTGELLSEQGPARLISEAERRQLTVMFCDLADSTQLSQQLDPEDLREVIRAYHQTSTEVVQRFDGTIAQHLGDGLLIYFGWPVAHEDDAQRALHAGLGIVEAITTTLNPRLEREHGVQLTVRIGIHTGPVVVGAMGGGQHENLATGETVNIATRLEGLAAPNTVVLSQVTARLGREAFVLEELGPRALKGIAESVRVFRVLGAKAAAANDAVGGSVPSLVGREEEVGLLLRRWEQSKAGFGQAVLISGAAGIGKSSLAATGRAQAAREGATCLALRCSPYHTNSAFHPVIVHLEQLLGLRRDETSDAKLAKLEQALGATSVPLDEAVPVLGFLLSVPLGNRYATPTQSPQQQRQQTLDTLVAWLMAEAEQRPVLVVWEDLHWADPSTLELLGLVLEQTPTVPMLHVLTFRPEFVPPWPTRSHLTPITLNRLERLQVEAWIPRMTGGKALPSEVVEYIVTKTDGVPLYVEELTRMLLASDLLCEEAEQYGLTGSLNTIAIPDTLQDSLMARLDQLHEAKDVAQFGAVLGREFSYDLLQAIWPQDEEKLRTGLGQLVEAELLYQRGRPPRARYIFKHALIQDAAYASLLRSTRQHLHRQIVQTLSARFPDVAAAQPELMAHHCTAAGHYAQAVDSWQRAGEHASSRLAYREAVSCYERALQVLQHLPESRRRSEQAIDLRLALRDALQWLGAYVHIVDHLREAETLAAALGDQQRLGRVLSYLASYFNMTEQYAEAITACHQVLDLARAQDDGALQAEARHRLAFAHYVLGAYGDAIRIFESNVTALNGNTLHESFGPTYLTTSYFAVISRAFLALCHGEMGQFAIGRQRREEAVRLAESIDHPQPLTFAYGTASGLEVIKGDLDQALPLLERASTLCRTHRLVLTWPAVGSFLALGYALSRQASEAMRIIDEITPLIPSLPRFFLAPNLIETYLLAGALDDAWTLARRVLETSSGENWQGIRTHTLRLLGDIQRPRDGSHIEQAETYYRQALPLAQELGMRPLQAHCHRGLGTLYSQTGQSEHARAELSRAVQMYRDLEMTFWVPEVEATLEEVEG